MTEETKVDVVEEGSELANEEVKEEGENAVEVVDETSDDSDDSESEEVA